MNGRRGLPLLLSAVIIILFLLGFLYYDAGLRTAPTDRVDEQNRGVDAPSEQVPSPGTHKDPDGDTELPGQ